MFRIIELLRWIYTGRFEWLHKLRVSINLVKRNTNLREKYNCDLGVYIVWCIPWVPGQSWNPIIPGTVVPQHTSHTTHALSHPSQLAPSRPSHPTCSTETDNLAVDGASRCPFCFFASLSFSPKDVTLTSLVSLIIIPKSARVDPYHLFV